MLSKEQLRKEFSKEPKRYYSTKLFEKEGLERKQCKECGKFFWTADQSRELCGDPAHEPYSFISKKPRRIGYEEFWNMFSGFFKRNGHKVIERYPVVSRWRPDLYFTIASIQDFQRIENNQLSFEYNANPLIVPQMCMRFNDLPNVGVNGRHLTSFMMAGQHAFNYPKEGYWRERCIELNYNLLTKVMGIKKGDFTYIEDVWAMGDFSEFGPCLEFFSKGSELGNNVFTQFKHENGKTEELKGKVVDVGWGFERMLWYYTGAQTIYDAVFPNELEYIYKHAPFRHDHALYSKLASLVGKVDLTEVKGDVELEMVKRAKVSIRDYRTVIRPMQAAYAIADHARSLLFAINDGALPSNIGGGYNLRIVLRRIFDFMDRYQIDIDIIKLMELEAMQVKNLYKGLEDALPEMNEIISIEKQRYSNTKTAALKIVTSIVEKKEKLTPERMRTLYESNGITPDFVSEIAKQKGVAFDLPDELYTKVMKGDFAARVKQNAKLPISVEKIKPTGKLFYKNAVESKSRAVRIEGNFVILDKTPFYPESGGQECDTGTINGIRVKDVQYIGSVVVHELEAKPPFKEGAKAECKVDIERRMRLTAHHSATHLINASTRRVLGKHAWQEGTRKSFHKAHIDMSHYDKLSDEQVKQIENTANNFILKGLRVSVDEVPRGNAESKYGFSIYQGHGVPSKTLRMVTIWDLDGNLIDAQACGGLHVDGKESMLGMVRIISTSRPHDGVDRMEFVAGLASLDTVNNEEKTLKNIANLSGLDMDKLNDGIRDRMEELQRARRESKKLADDFGRAMKPGQEIVIKEMDYSRQTLRAIATAFIEENPSHAIILTSKKGEVVCIAGHKSGKNALNVVKEHFSKNGKNFIGGGAAKMAEGNVS